MWEIFLQGHTMSTTGDCIIVSEDRFNIYQDKILVQRSLTQKGKSTRVGAGSPWLPRSSHISTLWWIYQMWLPLYKPTIVNPTRCVWYLPERLKIRWASTACSDLPKTLKEIFKSTRQTNLEYLQKLGLIMILIIKSEWLERDICITYTKQGEKIKRNFKRTKKISSQIWLCTIFVKSLNCKANYITWR